MEEIVVTKDELVEMFVEGSIKDDKDGWLYKDTIFVNIIALHDKDPKYVYDVTNAEYYRLAPVKQV
jgi:hypothetical protein